MEEAIWQLRDALQKMVDEHPCEEEDPDCNCPTCSAEGVLAATSDYDEEG